MALRSSVAAALILLGGAALAQPMIDPSKMSGIPRPDPQQAAGSISVKLLRGDFAHPLVGVDVTLDGPGGPKTMKTDETAHAVFKDLPTGRGTYVAKSEAFAESLESQPIELPASPGVRLMLVFKRDEKALLGEADGVGRTDERLAAGVVEVKVIDGDDKPLAKLDVALANAGDKGNAKHVVTNESGIAHFDGLAPAEGYSVSVMRDGSPIASQPFSLGASAGSLVALRAVAVTHDPKVLSIGKKSHLIAEVRDEELEIVENLVIENASASPFDPGKGGLNLPLAEGAENPQLGPEAPSSLTVAGGNAKWSGLFPPGETSLSVAFTLPQHDGAVEVHQTMPLAVDAIAMIVERYEGMNIEGPGLEKEERSLSGRTFWLVRGPAVKAGDSIEVRLSGLPQRSTLGRDAAVALAALIALWGFGWSWSRHRIAAPTAKLMQRKEELLEKLAALDNTPAKLGKPAQKQREELLQKLERVYREIDETGV